MSSFFFFFPPPLPLPLPLPPHPPPNPNPNPNPNPTPFFYCYLCSAFLPVPCPHHFLSSAPPFSPSPPPFSPPSPSSLRLLRPSRRAIPPASPAFISSLPSVQISDSSTSCPICRDDFALNSFALRLACNHLFHSECIVPWLELSGSCPVCRARVEEGTETQAGLPGGGSIRRELRVEVRSGVRRVIRVRRVAMSQTQMGQEGTGGSGSGTSGETVSSGWNEGLGFNGGGLMDEDGDMVMSDAREVFFG